MTIREALRSLLPARFSAYTGERLNSRTRVALEEGSLPPPNLMYLVAGSTDANWFFDSGRMAVESIEASLQRVGASLNRLTTVLDFGCGAGRVIRHLHSYSNLALCGCDYNPTLVEWCRTHLRFAEFKVNALGPPLRYSDGQFDLIYAFSVFTHLSVVQQQAWLAELGRVLRPGGFLVLSTHGDAYRKNLNSEQLQRYLADEIVVTLSSKEGKNDCAAYHPPGAFRLLAATAFDVIDFVPVVRKNLCKSECASSWCRSRLFSGIVPKNSVRRSCFVRS